MNDHHSSGRGKPDDAIQRYVKVGQECLDEIVLFLSKDIEGLNRENIGALCRRTESIRTAAEEAGLENISALATRLEKYMAEDIDYHNVSEKAHGKICTAARTLGHYTNIVQLRINGYVPPEGFDGFLKKDLKKALACLDLEKKCVCMDNEKKNAKCLRILVADDDQIIRMLFRDIYKGTCHLLYTVNDGNDAIKAIDSGMFDLVFTDINMPGANGLIVLQHAKKVSEDIEVAIITGYASVENAIEATRFGAYDYLTKPFNAPMDIIGVTNRVGEHISMREKNRRLITEHKQRNDELHRYAASLEDALSTVEEKQKALVHADRMSTLGILSAGVAHEINNPTTFIRGNLQTLDKFWNEVILPAVDDKSQVNERKLRIVMEEMPGLIRDMINGTQRIAKIVNALRTFSHKDQTEQRNPTAIIDCIEGAIELVHNRIKTTVKVERIVPENLPTILADKQQLTQVFVNLFLNSADAIEGSNGGLIIVEAKMDEDIIEIGVEDNGCGIPKKNVTKIFNPFFTTKAPSHGTGLGLSTAHGIITDHGGNISIEDPIGGTGTRFTIRLPVNQQAAQHAQKNSPVIFIVDDNKDALFMLENAFKAFGRFNIHTFTDGNVALKTMESVMPDVLILDVMMPKLDGFEMIKRIRENPNSTSVGIVSITAMDTSKVREKLMTLGADYVFFKPFKVRDILDSVEKLVINKANKR